MLVILCQDRCRALAEKTASELVKVFAGDVTGDVTVVQIAAESATTWPGDRSWDELLVVIYNGKDFPAAGNGFIADYLQKRRETALLLPVAMGAAFRRPPEAAVAIKARI
jgi:hypothetical protein